MPEVSRFYGIVIQIFYKDHAPPHFHASYSGHDAIINIETLSLIKGNLPARALGLVVEWASLHQQELLLAFQKAEQSQLPSKIEPLK
ncbi:MAG: DUF4160 domain-containing protein [Chthoniobacterales bacterium]|nr:DUF4160 domain-containing protein [Chthoniobacterales bacterium]